MNIQYMRVQSIPEEPILDNLIDLHERIFGKSGNLVHKMKSKPAFW
ncbi:hypothetical protein ACFW35_03340 [Fictibacillus sp. NPDC058756]